MRTVRLQMKGRGGLDVWKRRGTKHLQFQIRQKGGNAATEKGQNVMSEGKDKRYLRIFVLTTTNEGNMEYVLRIQTSSPLPERKSLKS